MCVMVGGSGAGGTFARERAGAAVFVLVFCASAVLVVRLTNLGAAFVVLFAVALAGALAAGLLGVVDALADGFDDWAGLRSLIRTWNLVNCS
jgi:hypothetical protein